MDAAHAFNSSRSPYRRLGGVAIAQRAIGAFWCIMATKAARRGAGYFNGYRLGAWATHAASWLTTY